MTDGLAMMAGVALAVLWFWINDRNRDYDE